jgi:hypothetical protein
MTPAEARHTLRDVALLLSRCAGYWLDQRARSDGWTIHYAVDADVIATYMNPSANMAVGEVLSAADPRVSKVASRLLSDFILCDLKSPSNAKETKGSLLVITPHDAELDSMLAALRDKALNRVRSAQDDERTLASLFGRLHEGANDSEIIELLVDKAPWLIDALDDQAGALSEIRRFAALPPSRLVNLLLYRETEAASPFAFPAPPTDASEPTYDQYLAMYSKWKAALTRATSAGAKPDYAIRNDALVMSTIEWVNDAIREHKRRIVLITGSASLLTAADTFPLPAGDVVDSTFGDLYLRHPQAFLGDDGFFSAYEQAANREQAGTLRTFDWLNLILPNYIEKSHNHAVVHAKKLLRDLRSSQRALPAEARDRLKATVGEWTQQVGMAAVARGLSSAAEDPKSRAGRLVKELRRKSGRGLTATKLQLELTIAARRSITSMYGSAMYLALLELRTEDSKIIGVPALRFDEPYVLAQDLCLMMQQAMFQPATSALDLHSLYSQFRSVDRENYHAFVIHALAYAIRGHWFGTKTLCLLAINVVDNIPRAERNNRTGREAAYLLSVAERRLAAIPEDLARARQYLAMARERENRGAPPDPRFASETLANDVAVLNLRIGMSTDRVEAAEQAFSSLRDVFSRGVSILDRMRKNELREVLAWVRRQVTTNVINVALLAEQYSAGAASGYARQIRALLSEFRDAGLAPDSSSDHRFQDALSNVFYWAASAVFSDDNSARKAAARELARVVPQELGIDPERIGAIRQLGIQRARHPE